MRIVFNASAKCDNTSLNDKLLPGIDYLNSLVGFLTKFRHGKYAIMGDIKKMFLQVKVIEEDLDALRFVWRDSGQDEISYYVMLSHLFRKKDSPCIANWRLKQSVKNEAKIIQQTLNEKFYMDGFLDSLPNEIDLIKITSKIITVLNNYGFQLTKCVSNSPTVLKSLPWSEILPKFANLDLGSDASERTLGLIWNINTDKPSFKSVTKIFPKTKRGILSMISIFYDPLGILRPALWKPKKIIQDLCEKKIDWDETIPHQLLAQWNAWKQDLENITKILLNR